MKLSLSKKNRSRPIFMISYWLWGFICLSHVYNQITSTTAFSITQSSTYSTTVRRSNPNLSTRSKSILGNNKLRVVLHQSKSDNDNKDEELFYDDFSDFDVVLGDDSLSNSQKDGGEMNTVSSSDTTFSETFPSADNNNDENNLLAKDTTLSERIAQSMQDDMQRDARLAKNWRNGNWSVRGFALDKTNTNYSSSSSSSSSSVFTSSSPKELQEKERMDFLRESGVETEKGGSIPMPPRLGRELKNPAPTTDPKPSKDDDVKPIHITKIAMDEVALDDDEYGSGGGESNILAVGRADGNIYLVRLGSEYLTKFTAVPKLVVVEEDDKDGDTAASEDDAGGTSVRVQSEMVREDILIEQLREQQFDGVDGPIPPPSSGDGDSDDDGYENTILAGEVEEKTPFDILHQFQAHGETEAVSSILFHEDMLYTSAGYSGDIKMFEIVDEDDHDMDDSEDNNAQMKVIPRRNLIGAHADKVIAIKSLSNVSSSSGRLSVSEHNLLLSASLDGSFALWDRKTGDLVYKCQILDDDGNPVSINCVDVDVTVEDHTFYLGLSNGQVVGYVASEIINLASTGECPIPNCRFMAHDADTQWDDEFGVELEMMKGNKDNNTMKGVTAIACVGEGTMALSSPMNRNTNAPKTSVIVTGGADGTVKQYEILGRKIPSAPSSDGTGDAGTSWKLEHWPRLATQRMKRRAHIFKGHYGPVTALISGDNDSSKILSAGIDGTVRIWNPTEGEELYRMDGFTDGGVNSLCLDRDMLITDGMEDFVCVHDFDVKEDEFESGYDLDF